MVIQLGSETPILSMDINGHLMFCDNGDLRTALLQNLQCKEETVLEPAFKDISSHTPLPSFTAPRSKRSLPSVSPLQQQRTLHAAMWRRGVRHFHHSCAAIQVLWSCIGGRLVLRWEWRLRYQGGSFRSSLISRPLLVLSYSRTSKRCTPLLRLSPWSVFLAGKC